MIIRGFQNREFTLNENQEKVLFAIYDKRKNDEFWLRPNKGWVKKKTIKDRCYFNKNGTVVGCLQGFKKAGLVESRRVSQLDGRDITFYRITDEFYSYLRFHEKEYF